MTDFKFKETYGLDDLLEIMKILRSPSGCPWDMEQTHKSIKNDFIEEVYEAIEAIDLDDTALLREELGDVLLQVVFHCQIEKEKNNFEFDDICDELCKKLIVRHPHVFGELTVSDSGEVLKNWDNIKKETKGQKTYTDTLESVTTLEALSFPASEAALVLPLDTVTFSSTNVFHSLQAGHWPSHFFSSCPQF